MPDKTFDQTWMDSLDTEERAEVMALEPWRDESFFEQLADTGELVQMRVAGAGEFMARFVRIDNPKIPHFKLVPAPEACGLCHKDPAEGLASVGAIRYCHEGGSPTCYERASGSAGPLRFPF